MTRTSCVSLAAYLVILAALGPGGMPAAERAAVNHRRQNQLLPVDETDACRYSEHLLRTVVALSELYATNNNHLVILVPGEGVASQPCDLVGSLLRAGASSLPPVVLASEKRYAPRKNDLRKPTGYLVLNFTDSSLRFLVGTTALSWNPRALYICIVDDKPSAARVMAAMWTKFVYNVVAIAPPGPPGPTGQIERTNHATEGPNVTLCLPIERRVAETDESSVYETYTWRPYYPIGYCGPPTLENIVKLGETRTDRRYLSYATRRPAAIPRTFGKCKFKVRLNVWEPLVFPKAKPGQAQKEGLEYKLIRLGCDKLNLTFEFVEATEDNNDLFVDATAGTLIPQLRHLNAGEFTTSYLQDVLLWVVPQTEEAPRWTNLMRGFTLDIWIAVALALALVATTMGAAGTSRWGLLTWGSALENALPKVPRRSRLIWGPWLFLCLHLSAAYKTVLVGLLLTPVYLDSIETQEDIVNSDLRITFMTKGEIYFSRLDKTEGEILKRYVPCTHVPDCLDRAATKKDQAVFTNKMLVQHRTVKKYLTRYTARPGLRMLRPSLTYNIVMVMAKGHPMIAGFNKYFGLILDKGFMVHWEREIIEEWRRKQYGRSFPKNSVLTLEHLQGAFVVLGCGLYLALISCLFELLYRSWRARESEREREARDLRKTTIMRFK